jgi:hypothetical protein
VGYEMEQIYLTETSRLIVSTDEDAQNPREWGDEDTVSVTTLRQNSHYREIPAGRDTHGEIVRTIVNYIEQPHYTRGYQPARDEAITKHFTRAGIPFRIVEHMAERDYVAECVWYVEPEQLAANRELMPDWDAEAYLDSCIKEYGMWADNRVAIVSLERARRWVAVDLSDDEMTTWEEIESIGGCYLDDHDYPAEVVAREHFELTPEELAGMKVKLDAVDRRNAVPA